MSILDESYEMLKGMNYEDENYDKGVSGADPGMDLTFTINRATATIAGALPVAMFGPNHSADGYSNLLAPDLNGNSISSFSTLFFSPDVARAVSANYFFTYNDGVNTDDVTISLSNASYKSLMANLQTDTLYISEFQFEVDSVADVAQFKQPVKFVQISGYSRSSGNNFTPSTYNDARQQQNTKIHINRFGRKIKLPKINREIAMVIPMIDTADLNYHVTLSAGSSRRLV